MNPETETAAVSVAGWKERVLDLCRKPGVSMAEVSQMPGAGGQRSLHAGEDSNIVVWIGLQANLVTAICELLAENKITVSRASTLIYLVDGVHLTLPIAKTGKRVYKTPHWMPVVLNLVE
jgi:hypothetical protein